MTSTANHRIRGYGLATLSAVSLGIAVRFWRAVLTPPPPLTIDWTPGVYWLVGIVFTAATLQAVRSFRGDLSWKCGLLLLILNGVCLIGYLGVAAVLFCRSFADIDV